LSDAVSVFKVEGGHVTPARRPAASRPAATPKQPPQARQAIAASRKAVPASGELAVAGGSWETF